MSTTYGSRKYTNENYEYKEPTDPVDPDFDQLEESFCTILDRIDESIMDRN